MLVWLKAVLIGINLYKEVWVIAGGGMLVFALLHHSRINFMKGILDQLFVFYICCVCALVFFPLPTAEEAMNLTYRIQLVPFAWIANAIEEQSARAIINFALNIIMTIPLGMYLRYRLSLEAKQVLLISFFFTTFIEFGQLTGLFFYYQGSYRLCDVDDIISNTLGGYMGYTIVRLVEKYVPAIECFDLYADGKVRENMRKTV